MRVRGFLVLIGTLAALALAVAPAAAKEPGRDGMDGGGADPWIPLVSLNPVQGVSVGIGAGPLNSMGSYGSPDFNRYGLGVGAAYEDDAISLYVMGLKHLDYPDSGTQWYGDSATYRISAGGSVAGAPVGVGLDLFYLHKSEREYSSHAGFGTGPGFGGGTIFSVESVLFSGFFDGESALYRRSPGSNKPGASGLSLTGDGSLPTSIRAIGGHLEVRPLMETALQLGGAYLQFVEDVTSAAGGSRDETLGTAMYLRLTHGITDSVQLKAAFDYLFPSDTTREARGDEDAYKVAAGLFWSW